MEAEDRDRLDEIADCMIAEAQATGGGRVFSATGWAAENISIVHQQLRCINLAWALAHKKRVKRGDVIAIIGGSFSGLMLAVSLAVANDVVIYIFEKKGRLLDRFLDKSQRHLSPNLNSRYLGPGFNPSTSRPVFDPPIFRWESGVASDVASKWLHEFDEYQKHLPIFTFLDCEVTRQQIRARDEGLTIKMRTRRSPHLQPIEVNLLIDATGFGEEANTLRVADFSYWESGHRLIYDHLPVPSQVLISGCGDSGLIEAMHYAIKDFRHEMVEHLWPSRTNLEEHLDRGMEDAKLAVILNSSEVSRYDETVISEVCWWLGVWWRIENSKAYGWSLRGEGSHAPPIFRAIEEVLKPRLEVALKGRNLSRIPWMERESFACKLPIGLQLEVRAAVAKVVDAWISRRMANVVKSLPASKRLGVRKLHKMARPGCTVTLNGTMPTPFTRQLSTFNVWLMHVLLGFPNVKYLQGRLMDVQSTTTGQSEVTFGDGSKCLYDRVVTRYGPLGSSRGSLVSKRRNRDLHAGSWLLTLVDYVEPTADPHIGKRVEPAVRRVSSKIGEVKARRGSTKMNPVYKTFYQQCLLLGPTDSTQASEIYGSPQKWLTETLSRGVRPRYVDNVWTLEKERRNQSR